jgi:hypothetical protein
MYEYLFGVFILACIWVIPYLVRKDLRKAMVWSGLFYIFWTIVGFILYRLFAFSPDRSINPGYWSPPTLFNLGHKTGGLAIEDILFMFFVGGIATAIYELVSNEGTRKLSKKELPRFKKRYAILFAAIGPVLVYEFTSLNAMYSLIAFNLFGALAIMWQRRDLVKHSIVGGLLFLGAYFIMAMVVLHVFPNFVKDFYHLRHTSGVKILGVPLEEYLYGLTFGMLWSPIYEYEYKRKSVKLAHKIFTLKKLNI